MSMDVGKNKSVDIADTGMPDATTEDPELAHGQLVNLEFAEHQPLKL